jgi:transcription termination factor Rho
MRMIDILILISLRQRERIVLSSGTRKTVLLQGVANAISTDRSDIKLTIVPIDERPEEVTDFRRNAANAKIGSSRFDDSADNNVDAADMVVDKEHRQVEPRNHVVILLDSIQRLARVHNTKQSSSGQLFLSSAMPVLWRRRKKFRTARNSEGGGSLTIRAITLIET